MPKRWDVLRWATTVVAVIHIGLAIQANLAFGAMAAAYRALPTVIRESEDDNYLALVETVSMPYATELGRITLTRILLLIGAIWCVVIGRRMLSAFGSSATLALGRWKLVAIGFGVVVVVWALWATTLYSDNSGFVEILASKAERQRVYLLGEIAITCFVVPVIWIMRRQIVKLSTERPRVDLREAAASAVM